LISKELDSVPKYHILEPTQLAQHWAVWASIPKVVVSIPTVVRHNFKLARCGYTLRLTSQASYSPEYITPTKKKIMIIRLH
jgi:hypothetical protein